MLRMRGLTKIYRTELIETRALNEILLEVAAGEFVSVTGPSGSGKLSSSSVARSSMRSREPCMWSAATALYAYRLSWAQRQFPKSKLCMAWL